MPRATSPEPPSWSEANTKIRSPIRMSLPRYIVFSWNAIDELAPVGAALTTNERSPVGLPLNGSRILIG